jgi:pyridoxine kinase
MKTILSIQSHVAFGYVGNDAAKFPLQRLGFNVIDINTVQFSNHTGYGDWEGDAVSADHIERVLKGIERRIPLSQIDGLLTGYMGNPDIASVILEAAGKLSPNAIWLCDPVMGDVGRGMFVPESIQTLFKTRVVQKAKIITPNQYELEFLTGHKVETLDHAREACRAAHAMGPEIVLLTSLIHDQTKDNEIQMLASHKDGSQFIVTTPRLPLDPAPNGAGDCTAALFLAHNLNGETLDNALAKTAGSIYAVFEATMKAKTRELAIIGAQDSFPAPKIIPTLSF